MLLAGSTVTLGQGTLFLFPAWLCESLPGDPGDGFCHHQLLGDGCVQTGLSCPHTTPSHSLESDAHGLMIPCQLQKPLTGTGNIPSPGRPDCGSTLCILGQGWFGLA